MWWRRRDKGSGYADLCGRRVQRHRSLSNCTDSRFRHVRNNSAVQKTRVKGHGRRFYFEALRIAHDDHSGDIDEFDPPAIEIIANVYSPAASIRFLLDVRDSLALRQAHGTCVVILRYRNGLRGRRLVK